MSIISDRVIREVKTEIQAEKADRLESELDDLREKMRESFETGKPVLIGYFLSLPVTVSVGKSQ